ncbi:hypothetical protein GAYE_SCF25G4442 [Galdieria yellowstonensis]|uniref:Formamidopyrimidine-DNA glycosylase catalytic domain-containing protein n=1 Tax=Galdieria yellowstonensis TaxID=3028027 RepID=A0AAV9IH14_9RHOD|nr:hypothetical protein GAYE_SCF25G4442 [Galdieria yellowstonensis]
MPELIEVERFRQFIVQHLPWESVIENILFSHDAKSLFPKDYNISLDTIPKLVVQKKVQHVQRYGKYLWLELPPSVYILFHFGMTGSLVYKKATDGSLEFASDGKQHYKSLIQDWPSPYAKLRLVFADGTELAFLETRKLGKLMVTEQHPMQLPFISCLGFDPILSHPSVDDLLDKFQRPHSAVKTVLLNGTVIAGIGNWMADEILFKSKIHPLELSCNLPRTSIESLWEATQQIVQQGLKKEEEYPEDWLFHVRWKKDKSQLQSRGIEILHVGGRTTLYVPRQQQLLKESNTTTTTTEKPSEQSDSEPEKDSPVIANNNDRLDSTEAETRHMRDIYRCLCTCEEDGITQQDLYKVVDELDSEKWKDEDLIKDAIALFSSSRSGKKSIRWEDFVNIYRQVQNNRPQ